MFVLLAAGTVFGGLFAFATISKHMAAQRAAADKRLEDERFDKDFANLQTKMDQWQDALKVAVSTGRIALAGPVSTMQSIRRETAGMVLGGCLSRAKDKLVGHMDKYIDSMLAFMAQHEKESTELSSEAAELIDQAAGHVEACKHIRDKPTS